MARFPAKYLIGMALLSTLPALQACQNTGYDTPVVSQEEQALLTRGDTARALGRYEKAKQHYTEAAELSKGAVRAHLELAGIHQRSGNAEAARQVLKDAYTLNPHSLEVAKGYAQNLLQLGETQDALRIATKAAKHYPGDVRLLNLRGVALDRMGRHDEAGKLYTEAMQHSSTQEGCEVTANNHALSLVASGKYDAAIRMVEVHIPHAQLKPASRQLLALIYGIKGDTDKAYELGLRDLSLQQVNENLRFYKQVKDGIIPAETLFMPAG